jgi:D-lactate dehydrogenase (cytochrome)
MQKIDSLELEHGEAVDVMKSIKAALDPRGIMNPGKMLRMPARAQIPA